MPRLRREASRRGQRQPGEETTAVDGEDPFAFTEDAWDAEPAFAVQTSPRRKRTRIERQDALATNVSASIDAMTKKKGRQLDESIDRSSQQDARDRRAKVKRDRSGMRQVSDEQQKAPNVTLQRPFRVRDKSEPRGTVSRIDRPADHEKDAETDRMETVAPTAMHASNPRPSTTSDTTLWVDAHCIVSEDETPALLGIGMANGGSTGQPPVPERDDSLDEMEDSLHESPLQQEQVGKRASHQIRSRACTNSSDTPRTKSKRARPEKETERTQRSTATPCTAEKTPAFACQGAETSEASQPERVNAAMDIHHRAATPQSQTANEGGTSALAAVESPRRWRRGQLMRLRLHQFLAFDEMEILPGNTLNLVVGPNGSGKSSIVAGICIGLGGKLELLARAPLLSSYIKHGCDRAQIDIELFDPTTPDQRRRISRFFRRDGRHGFTLDGAPVAKRVIDDLCAELDIQLDNVCTFLPQERVPELVESTPIELLRHTVRAVLGNDALTSLETLANREAAQAERLRRDAADQARLTEWIRQNEALEAELRFYEERQALLEEIEHMRIYRPYCIYEICRQEAVAAREAFKAIDREYRTQCAAWETTCAPLRSIQQEWMRLQKERERMKQTLGQTESAMQRQCLQMNEALARFDEANDELARLEMDIAERKRNHEGCQRKVERLEAELQQLLERFGNAATLDKAIEEKRWERQQAAERALQASEAIRRLEQQQLTPLHRQRQELLTQRDRLSNIRQHRLALVQRRNPHTQVQECYRFVTAQREAGRFQGQVWGPLPLEIHTTDAFHSDVLETVLSGWLEVAFVFESPNDERIVFQESQRNRWRINTIALVRPDLTLHAPAPLEMLQPYGIQAFLIDCFEASASLKRALADAVPIHLIALADARARQHVRELALTHRIFALFTPQNGYRSRLSRYDPKEVSIRVEALHRRTGLYAMPDEHQLEQIERQLEQVEAQVAQRRSELDELEQQEKTFRIEERTLQQQVAALLEGRKQLRHAQQRLSMQQSLLSSIARDLENTEKDAAQRKRWQMEKERAACRYAALVCTASEHLQIMQDDIQSLTQLTWQVLDQQRMLEAGERSLAAAALAMQALVQKREEARQQLDAAKARMRRTRQEAEQVAPLTEQLLNQLRAWQFPESVEALDERIARAQARADALVSVSAEVVETFERRQRQIAELRQRLERARQQNTEEHQALEQERDAMVRKLRALASSLSSSFSNLLHRLDCFGQVDLIEEDTLQRFALRIQVKFRSAEPLRELSAHHHSGGEKMVATMLYLLAMQQQARPPLRVIDEMNQGMDPHNERAILQMMMEASENADMPQTLLISPKMLLDLKYSSQMVLHCVLNGPHLSWRSTCR